MYILNSFDFFKDKSDIGESEIVYNPNMGSQLILDVSGTFAGLNITVYGAVKDNWNKLAVIDMSTFSSLNSITKKGIYAIGVDGISKVKLSITGISNGSVNIFGKLGY